MVILVVAAIMVWMNRRVHKVNSKNILRIYLARYEQLRQRIYHISQDTKLLSLCDFQADKIANVLPHSRMAAQALKGAALHRVGSGW